MSFVVTPNLSDITLCESTTGFSTGSLDADFFKQGNNSLGFYMSKNNRNSITYTYSGGLAWSGYTYPHLYWWMNSAVAAKMENKTTGTTTASGVTVRVTLTSGAYREWHVCGADTWDGGWTDPFVIDLSHTGTQLYASGDTGTPWSNLSAIASVTWYFDLSNSGNIRNVPANCWLDAVRVGDGLKAWNTSASDPSFGFGDIAAQDEATANQWGVLQSLKKGAAGSYGAAGAVTVGDDFAFNHVDFQSNDESVTFLERDGSGYGLVNANLYTLKFVGNPTGSDQSIILGTKVGSGDSMSGRNGTQIRAGGSTVDYSVDLSNAYLHTVGWYGSTIQGAKSGISVTGVPTTTFEMGGCTIDTSGQLQPITMTIRNTNFLNTTAPSTSGALDWNDGTTDAKNCLFVNNTVAVEMASLTADPTFVGMEFQSNTNDVRYEGTTNWNLNWSDSLTEPTILNASTGTLTAVNTVTTTIKGVPTGAEWRLYVKDPTQGIIGSTELDGAESHTGGDITYNDNYSSDTSAALQVMADGYEEYLRYFTLGSAPQTITVVFSPEENT